MKKIRGEKNESMNFLMNEGKKSENFNVRGLSQLHT